MLETVQILTGESPSSAVIWMHGLGADGNDFVPIVRELDLSGCPAIRFVFPHADYARHDQQWLCDARVV